MIDWTKLRTKFGLQKAYEKFEQLALMYVSDVYPQYEWEATPQKGDGNRDIQLIQKKDMGYDIWAEAKYRNSSKKQKDELRALERKDIDSTILSGLLHGKVRLIIFISNARLPNKVMDRAMLGARIRGIEVTAVLSTQLENWLIKKPERYQKIFEEELHADPAEIIMYDVESASIFDPVSVDFNPLNKKQEFCINELGLLNLIVYSYEKTTGIICDDNNLPFIFIEKDGYENHSCFSVKPGISNLVFLIKMKKQQNTSPIRIHLKLSNYDFFMLTNNIRVKKSENTVLTYARQLEVIHKVNNSIRTANSYANGLFVTLYAESSMGKSFVLRNIYNDLCANYDLTLISFDSNQNNLTNYMLLCKCILFVNFGNVFWDYDFSSKNDIELFKENVVASYNGRVFATEVLLKVIDGCFDANIAASLIRDFSDERKTSKTSFFDAVREKQPKVLLIDDFHYLDKTQAKFVIKFFEELKKHANNIILVIASTKGKYKYTPLENYFLELTPNYFLLEGLTQTDKEQTLQKIYDLQKEKCSAAGHLLPGSPLLAGEVIRAISNKLTKRVKDPMEIILAYSKSVDETNILQNKFSDSKKQYYLLDIIYLFKKGLHLNILKEYFKSTISYKTDLKSLAANNLIVIERGYVFPYHDFYTNAYKNMRKSKMYNMNVGRFLSYLLDISQKEKMIDENLILSMILRCGKTYRNSYETAVQKLILKYVQETQFGVATYFCEYYYDHIKSMERDTLSHDQSYYLYLYADCMVHCGKQGQAYQLLTDIYQRAPTNSLPKYEAGASVLTQLFWRLKPEKMIADSLYIQNGLERIDLQRLSDIDMKRVEKAYDSCFNRRMMAYFLKDDPNNARKTYIHRLKIYVAETTELKGFSSKAATIIMDYAKSITIYKIEEGYRLMKLALRFFEVEPEIHYRRILMCHIDMAVLENIYKNKYDADVFYDYSKKLLAGKFYSEYFKSVLKRCVCSLISYSKLYEEENCFSPGCQIIKDIEADISQALLETELLPLPRDRLLLSYLKAFFAICERENTVAQEILENGLALTSELGESYSFCIQHNLNNLSTVTHIKWYSKSTDISENDYLVDCRFW